MVEKLFGFLGALYEDVIYHTYHGTKGEEYANVIIIMEKGFGKDKTKFSNFFTNFGQKLEGERLIEFTKTRNLVYVACSRAIKNLRILYLDDTSVCKDRIEAIFCSISNFKVYKN